MTDWEKLRKKHDPQDYYDDLINFPEHINKALNQLRKTNIPEYDFNNILVCGMGGSGIPGHLLKNYCYHYNSYLVDVENSYKMPEWVDEKTLVFIISYSGNTEETLSCLVESMNKTKNIIVISSDGLLKKAADKHNLLFIKAPTNLQPRAATPYLFTYLLECLKKLKVLDISFNETLKNIKKLKEEMKINKENSAKNIAEQLINKYIYIYVSRDLESIGRRYQAQDFNENSKMLAKYSVIPESNHNELTALGECQNIPLVFLFLRDGFEPKSIMERTDFVKKIAEKKGSVIEINSMGKSLISRMYSLIFQGDMISYYTALLRGINPLPVPLVEELKKVLKKKTDKKKSINEKLGLI